MIDFSKTNTDGDKDTLNDGDVIQNTSQSIKGDQSKLFEKIPGATHNPEITDIDSEPVINEAGKGAANNHSQPKENFNPDFDEMGPGEQDEAAAMTAGLIIHGYNQLKLLAGSLVAISERKIKKLDALGLIDMHMPISTKFSPFPIPLTKHVENFNETIYAPLQPRPGFVENVTPVLTRILKKKGAVLSDEGILIGYWAEDVIVTTQALGKGYNQRVDFIEELKNMYQRKKEEAPSAPVTPDVSATAKETVDHIVSEVKKD